jgi:hypothetical protein
MNAGDVLNLLFCFNVLGDSSRAGTRIDLAFAIRRSSSTRSDALEFITLTTRFLNPFCIIRPIPGVIS